MSDEPNAKLVEAIQTAIAECVDASVVGDDGNPIPAAEVVISISGVRDAAESALKIHSDWLQREPTNAQILKLSKESGRVYGTKYIGFGPLKWHWQAVVLAALKEDQPNE